VEREQTNPQGAVTLSLKVNKCPADRSLHVERKEGGERVGRGRERQASLFLKQMAWELDESTGSRDQGR
jgi:hypothetical protein